MVHYGGFYTLTDENWPLLGPTELEGFYVAGALSGFGTMAACASGELLAQHILGADLPDYADMLSPLRYQNPAIVAQMRAQQSRGIL
jgi:glycine/D-amino acid oxidase-like deaminating enzyme